MADAKQTCIDSALINGSGCRLQYIEVGDSGNIGGPITVGISVHLSKNTGLNYFLLGSRCLAFPVSVDIGTSVVSNFSVCIYSCLGQIGLYWRFAKWPSSYWFPVSRYLA